MKQLKKLMLSFLLLFAANVAISQTKITGTITDSEMKGSLPAANVIVKGTNDGASTDINGKFTLSTSKTSGEVVITFIGYVQKTISFSGQAGRTVDLGEISLDTDASQLEEVVIIGSGVLDIAKDRKTPVAVSTVRAAEIQEKLGNKEFPEILNHTPSVYVTKSGGGFGDSRMTIRGFSQNNIAVMINGMPVNDMENSAVFWSNWAGLSDVTTAMQVQRGLGSSKLAISSIGGTVNIVTRAADRKEGGSVSASVANNNYIKTLATYSTGKLENGLSASVLLSQTRGDGYVDGTRFASGNYYVGIGYQLNDKHDFQVTFTGAPQWHNQRSTAPTIAQYRKYSNDGDPDIKYNSDWGYLDGKEYSFRTNYYHKPVASLNWDYKINETTKLSTVLYASWGRGGGSNGAGAIRGNRFFADALKTADGLINVGLIRDYNSGLPVSIGGQNVTRTQTNGAFQNNATTSNNTTNGISQISSINSHNWYGGVISLNKKLTESLVLDFGLDLRTYKGIHYQNITDLLGADNYADNLDANNPNRVLTYQYAARPHLNPFFNADYQQKINYNNDGLVNWYGAFTQLEYSKDNLTAFIQGAVSNQGFRRDDYFKYLSTDPLYSTDYENILGGNIKGGANYNIDENQNIYVNGGYYSKQPFFNAVYPNNQSMVNQNLTNEKILGLEAGYGYRSEKFNANVNVYRTTWKDRFLRLTTTIDDDLDPATPGVSGSAFLQGVEQIHMGAELDLVYKPFSQLAINGMFSIGNYKYGSNVTANYQNDNNEVITNPSGEVFEQKLFIDGLKVGDAAQTTASLGATFEIVKGLKIDGSYRYVDNLYASISPENFKTQIDNDKGTLQLPGYGLMDAGFSYKMLVGKDKSNSVNFRLNVDNVLNEIYIAESRTNIHAKTVTDFTPTQTATAAQQYATYRSTQIYDGLDTSNQVFFGFGRTWNFTIRYDF